MKGTYQMNPFRWTIQKRLIHRGRKQTGGGLGNDRKGEELLMGMGFYLE